MCVCIIYICIIHIYILYVYIYIIYIYTYIHTHNKTNDGEKVNLFYLKFKIFILPTQ